MSKEDDNKSGFPPCLLDKPISERLQYFKAFTVKHPLLLSAYEELRCAVRDANPGSIIFILGPTGAGKTTLLNRLEKYFIETLLKEMEVDTERFPIATTQLMAPISGSFEWKDYFKELLLTMGEPLVDDKENMEPWQLVQLKTYKNSRNKTQLIWNDTTGAPALRFASIQTLKHRRPMAVLIDDAQHFGIISSGRRLLDQLNAIKSHADKSKVTHVLCGTYELNPLRNLNGQLSRRSIDIHFERYHAEDETQREDFRNVLHTFQQHIPLPEMPDLVSCWDYFYERSIGCIGVLKDWLTRSLALALEKGSSTLSLKDIEHRALSVTQCATILRETTTGEKELKETVEARLNLRQNLGLPKESLENTQQHLLPNSLEQPSAAKSRRGKHRVGTRNPVRDKIGVKVA